MGMYANLANAWCKAGLKLLVPRCNPMMKSHKYWVSIHDLSPALFWSYKGPTYYKTSWRSWMPTFWKHVGINSKTRHRIKSNHYSGNMTRNHPWPGACMHKRYSYQAWLQSYKRNRICDACFRQKHLDENTKLLIRYFMQMNIYTGDLMISNWTICARARGSFL